MFGVARKRERRTAARRKSQLLERGSSASRSPSPNSTKPSIVKPIITAGKSARVPIEANGAHTFAHHLAPAGMGGLIPIPRKLNPASCDASGTRQRQRYDDWPQNVWQW